MTRIRLLTFNTLFTQNVRARLRALASALARADHDIVCLQEVMYRRNARLLRHVHPYRAFTGSVLLKGGLVLLSRWPIVRYRFVRYPMTAPVRPELFMRKGAQLASVATPDGELVVVNTHLSANRDDDWSPANRYTRVEQAELAFLAGRLEAVDASVPVVLVGDLNVPRDSSVLQEFLARTGLRDVLAADPRPTYRPTPRWPDPPAFDHVLVRGGLQATADLVLQDEVVLDDGRSAYLSDHYGVAAELDGVCGETR